METPFTYENLTWAARECMKGVAWKNGTARWRMHILAYCRRLEIELATGKYRMGRPNTFRITSPKERTVSALLFRDRVVHKVICHQGGLIADMFRNAYIDNCACQTGKGTTFAIGRMKKHLRRHYLENGADGYVVDMDVRKFFDSIPHDQLIEQVYFRVRLPIVRKMVRDIIESYPGDRGIGLGSEISQVLANSYLTAVDFMLKQRLGVRHCVRYADNIICILPKEIGGIDDTGNSVKIDGKEYARTVYDGVRHALHTLGLDVNPKSSIHPLSQGFHFLGFRWRLKGTGSIRLSVLRKSRTRIRRRLRRLVRKYRAGQIEMQDVLNSYQSWAAYAGQGEYDKKKIRDELMEMLR